MRKMKMMDPVESERIVWREIMRSPESRYDHRLHGILFVCRGMSCYESAAIWGNSPRAVEYWVRKFEKNGIEGLWEKPRPGRPSYLSALQLRGLEKELLRSPRELGHARGRWTGEVLRLHLSQAYRVELGLRQCQRLLKRLT